MDFLVASKVQTQNCFGFLHYAYLAARVVKLLMAPLSGVVAVSMRLHHWELGFRQYSFRPIVRIWRDVILNAFRCLPLFGHAVCPSGFRFQVNPMIQKSSSELLLSETRIQRSVPRRTLSTHPAQALANAPTPARGRPHGPSGQPVRYCATANNGTVGSRTSKSLALRRQVCFASSSRFAHGSHTPTPEGSLPAFAARRCRRRNDQSLNPSCRLQ